MIIKQHLRKISVITAIFLSLSLFSGFSVLHAEEITDGKLELLNELNIMTGDPDGNMRLNDTVTRAEFTKAAIAASSYKNSVATNLSISPFYDVTYKHWAAPYVRVAVTNGLVSGYPDSSFRPDDTVLFEEALTIMLRVLGYTDSDFGASWPYGQIGLANNLDMTDNMNSGAGQILNRYQVAQLIYNTLCTKQKGQAAELINIFDADIVEDMTIISDSNSDTSIPSDQVYTTSGMLKTDDNFNHSVVGMTGDAIIKNGNKIIAFIPDTDFSDTESYIVYSVMSGSVIAYKNGTITQLDISDSTTVYKGKNQTNFGGIKTTLELGDNLKVRTKNGSIDYITWQEGKVLGPTTVLNGLQNSSWNINDATKVTRDGTSSSVSDLKNYDVAYFLPDMNIILAYSDKITGIYENASPNKDMPASVTISGKTYNLDGSAAFSKLGSGGKFQFGDTVTALIGKDGSITDVISPDAQTTETITGYLIGTGNKDYQTGAVNTYTSQYVQLVLPDGSVEEYMTNTDYSAGINKIMEVTFDNGYAKCSVIDNAQTNIHGKFDWNNKSIGKNKLASSVKILDIGTTNQNHKSVYAAIYPQRLDEVNISASQILHYSTNSSGEITSLILNDVTGDGFNYGYMSYAKNNLSGDLVSGTYEFVANGNMYSINTSNRALNINSGTAVKIAGNLSNPDYFTALNSISEKITSIASDRIIAGNKTYILSPNVSVYKKHNSMTKTYTQMPLSDIVGKTELNITAYYDKESSAGGRVRVIIVY